MSLHRRCRVWPARGDKRVTDDPMETAYFGVYV